MAKISVPPMTAQFFTRDPALREPQCGAAP
jgi:hypothetical protein